MSKTLYIFMLLSCVVSYATPPPPIFDELHTDQQCYHNGGLSKKERLSIYPFNSAKKTRAISFNVNYVDLPIKDKQLIRDYIIDNIVLTETQIDNFTDILYNYNYSEDTRLIINTEYGCSNAMHAIIFENEDENIISYIQIDIECQRITTDLPLDSLGSFCEGKYELLYSFLKTVGITHYEDMPFDIELEDLKTKEVQSSQE